MFMQCVSELIVIPDAVMVMHDLGVFNILALVVCLYQPMT